MKLAIQSMLHNKGRTLLILLLSFLSFVLALLTITHAFAFRTQKKMILDLFLTDLEETYQLNFLVEDMYAAGETIYEYKKRIAENPQYVSGGYDVTGVYFDELADHAEYLALNQRKYAGTFREQAPLIAETVFIDPAILDIISFPLQPSDFSLIEQDGERYLPLYLGADFKSVFALGEVLTLSHNGARYMVKGYLDRGTVWLNDDLTMPPITLDHKFLTPYSDADRFDFMTQLSTSGKFMVISNDPASQVSDHLQELTKDLDMKVAVKPMSENMEEWSHINEKLQRRQIFLAGIVLLCSALSIISTLTVSILLRKKEFAIRIAFGATKRELMIGLLIEVLIVQTIAAIVSLAYVYSVNMSPLTKDFHQVYLITLGSYSLTALMLLMILFLFIVLVVPLSILSRYEAAPLMKEETA
ncbi:hypothetical protein PRECH8_21020 [Insulibacter thermoxylanivorax]|uniref:ABC3 transporter permease C-terminal domain-containing protein n=1 Tax=Insulibacter thermoxylanivorax TaxID=2749268 RepID=A0A916QHZ9_9BACL|nr:ABC transporter permease [Insulibacter thermoxylanivorax]GFR38806.1 hypothetical protein PRECH8_21020 [Insulibacter thermoxylanivorax]